MRSNSSAKRTTVSSKSCRRHEVSPSARSTRVSIKSKDKNAHAQGACTPLDVATVSAKSPTSSSAAFLPSRRDGLELSTLVCPGPIVAKLHAERGARSTDSPIPAALSKSYPILFLQSQKHISVWSARRRRVKSAPKRLSHFMLRIKKRQSRPIWRRATQGALDPKGRETTCRSAICRKKP
jgi:hypothetical protein